MRKLIILFALSIPCFAQLPPCDQKTGGVLTQSCLDTINANFPKTSTTAGSIPCANGVCTVPAGDNLSVLNTVLTVATAAQLTSALSGSVAIIILASGTYSLANGISVPSGFVLAGAGEGQTILSITGANQNCITFLGVGAAVRDLTCSVATGGGSGLVFNAASTSINSNRVDHVTLSGPLNSNGCISMTAVSGSNQVAHNLLTAVDCTDFVDSLDMLTSGTVGPTDNQIVGGNYKKSSQGGKAINLAAGSDNKIVGVHASNHATAISGTAATTNHLVGLTLEANVVDVNFSVSSCGNELISVSGSSGGTFTDSGNCNYVLSGSNGWGAAGSVYTHLPPQSGLALNSSSGWPVSFTSTAGNANSILLPAVGGTVGWQKWIWLKIANGTADCLNANGCWTINGGPSINAVSALTQEFSGWAPGGAKMYAQGGRLIPTAACSGASSATVSVGQTGNDAVLFNSVNVAVAPGNGTFTDLGTGHFNTLGSAVPTLLVTTTVSNVDQLVAGCSFTVYLNYAVTP